VIGLLSISNSEQPDVQKNNPQDMSYSIAIVTPPFLANDAEACDALDALIELDDEIGGQRPAIFQNLHDALTARYPCISLLSGDELSKSLWSDGPLINNFGHRVAVLGKSGFRAAEALPFLIATSNSMGCCVLDQQDGTVHRAA